MKWKKPNTAITCRPIPLNTHTSESATASPKEKLLREALKLAARSRQNEEAVSEIVEQALDLSLYGLLDSAINGFSSDSNFHLCASIARVFAPKHWRYHSHNRFVISRDRVVHVAECRAGIGFGGHFTDQRSSALGYLGTYCLAKGNLDEAIHLWELAADRIDVDEAIAEVCLFIPEQWPDHAENAITLTSLINTSVIRAKTMAQLARFI